LLTFTGVLLATSGPVRRRPTEVLAQTLPVAIVPNVWSRFLTRAERWGWMTLSTTRGRP